MELYLSALVIDLPANLMASPALAWDYYSEALLVLHWWDLLRALANLQATQRLSGSELEQQAGWSPCTWLVHK